MLSRIFYAFSNASQTLQSIPSSLFASRIMLDEGVRCFPGKKIKEKMLHTMEQKAPLRQSAGEKQLSAALVQWKCSKPMPLSPDPSFDGEFEVSFTHNKSFVCVCAWGTGHSGKHSKCCCC